MTDVQTLVEAMRLGKLPDWAQMVTMNVGDEIAAMMDRVDEGDELERDVRGAAEIIDPAGDRHGAANDLSIILARFNAMKATADGLRATLINYGALDPNDFETDALTLLRALLA